MMRLLVTGRSGQVASSLAALAGADLMVETTGRPEFDLEAPANVRDVIADARPDVVISAAAWTAVDLAETQAERARLANVDGPAAIAASAAALGIPVIHLSTDYVFDGTKRSPYVETDEVRPTSVYGATKLAGERAVATAQSDHVILRTAWVYAAEGKNFVRTMLRLAAERGELGVVADQIGNPTFAPDIAAGIVAVARRLLADPGNTHLRGTFHMSGAGETSWAGFAEAIFAGSAARGGPSARVRHIATAEYPTTAPRPANSRLDCTKLADVHGVSLPRWQDSLARCLDRLLPLRQGTET